MDGARNLKHFALECQTAVQAIVPAYANTQVPGQGEPMWVQGKCGLHIKFQESQSYTVRPCLEKSKKQTNTIMNSNKPKSKAERRDKDEKRWTRKNQLQSSLRGEEESLAVFLWSQLKCYLYAIKINIGSWSLPLVRIRTRFLYACTYNFAISATIYCLEPWPWRLCISYY